MFQSNKINLFMLCIVAFLVPRKSLSYSSKTKTDDAIILFEHEQDYQFDIFMKWLRNATSLTEANEIRKKFAKTLLFDEKKLNKDFLNLAVKQVIARHDTPKPNAPERCLYNLVFNYVSLYIDYSYKIKSCSFICTDKELIGKHFELTQNAKTFEGFITECKNKMWDVEELRRIPHPSKEHP